MFERILGYFGEKPEGAYDKAERLYAGAQEAAERGWLDVVTSNMRRIRSLDIETSEYTKDEERLVEKAHRRAAMLCMGLIYDRCEFSGGKVTGNRIRMARVGLGDGLWVGENGKLYVLMDKDYLPNRDFNPDNMLESKAYRVAQLGFDPDMVSAAAGHIMESGLPHKEEAELLTMLPKEPTPIEDPEPADVTEDVEPTMRLKVSYRDRAPAKMRVTSNRSPRVKKYLSGGSFVN